MAKTKVEDIRNIVLCGHGGSGKTTLGDTLLLKTGAVTGDHSVDHGNSVLDFDAEEKLWRGQDRCDRQLNPTLEGLAIV